MARNPLQRLLPLAGSSAASNLSRSSSDDSATLQAKIPQSQPMQRSRESQSSDSDSEADDCYCSVSPPSNDELTFDLVSVKSSSKPHAPLETLHSPLRPGDHALIRMCPGYVLYFIGVA